MQSVTIELQTLLQKIPVDEVHSFEPSAFSKYKEIAKSNAENGLVTALVTCTGKTPPTIAPMNFSKILYVVDVFLIEQDSLFYMVGIYSPNPFNKVRGN